jgi:IclR family transcriptional regulator, acetate operon repressor
VQKKPVEGTERQLGSANRRGGADLAEHGASPRYPIESVDNALKLLLMLRDRPTISLSEASDDLSVARSTAHRLLAMLAYHGFVRQDPVTKAYEAGPVLTEISFAALRDSDIRPKARPFIEELVREIGETVHLVVLNGTQVLFTDCVEGDRALRAGSRVGIRLPAHCTAGGKVLLAAIPDDQIRELYRAEELEQLTPRSVSTVTGLLTRIDETRRHGYALNDGESEEELRAVAVAIRDPVGRVRAAITLSAPGYRLPPEQVPGVVAAMRRTADSIGEILH